MNQGGNGNPTATIGHEPERTTVNGLQAVLSKQLSPRLSFAVGGDVHFEQLTSEAFNVNPTTGAVSPRRPRVPDGATFTQGGVFVQSAYDVRPDRVRLLGSLRAGGASYEARAADSPLVGGQPLWPDDSHSRHTPSWHWRQSAFVSFAADGACGVSLNCPTSAKAATPVTIKPASMIRQCLTA